MARLCPLVRDEIIRRKEKKLALYECVFIARQDISSTQVDSLTEHFESVITENGGSIAKRESWGLRTMAYKIKKNRKGHYVLLNIDAPAESVHEMERQMRINEDILRYMTLAVDEHEEGPSVIMRNKDRGDERPRGRGKFERDGGRPSNRDDAKPAEAEAKPAEPAAEEAPKEAAKESEGAE
jgi:small subunit ribosomal protein S6